MHANLQVSVNSELLDMGPRMHFQDWSRGRGRRAGCGIAGLEVDYWGGWLAFRQAMDEGMAGFRAECYT